MNHLSSLLLPSLPSVPFHVVSLIYRKTETPFSGMVIHWSWILAFVAAVFQFSAYGATTGKKFGEVDDDDDDDDDDDE